MTSVSWGSEPSSMVSSETLKDKSGLSLACLSTLRDSELLLFIPSKRPSL